MLKRSTEATSNTRPHVVQRTMYDGRNMNTSSFRRPLQGTVPSLLPLLLLLQESSSSASPTAAAAAAISDGQVVHVTTRRQNNRQNSERHLQDTAIAPNEEEPYRRVAETYLPIWFDRTTGYDGQTYLEALEFCESSVGDGYGLCPYDAVCPIGPNREPFGGYRSENDDSTGTYVPVRDGDNMWVQTAEGEDACVFWGAGGSSTGPLWGLTGQGSEEFTRSVMCCFFEERESEAEEEENAEDEENGDGGGGGMGEDDAVDLEESDGMPEVTTTTSSSTNAATSVVGNPLLPELGYVTQTWRVPQGYPEGIAYDKRNRRILLSSLVSGTIVALDVDDDMSRQKVYVPNPSTSASGMGLKVYDRGEDEDPLVYATLTNFETMDQGGLAIYELDTTEETIAFMNNAVDTSPYYMPCLDADTMCGMANDVVVTEEGVAYVTDSRNGRVFAVEDGNMELISDDPLLQSQDASFPFGANGLVYDERGFLLVGNTQSASLVRLDLVTGAAVAIPIKGDIGNVDGMLMHPDGRLLVITGTTIYFLRDEGSEWRSAIVEGVVNVDYSDAGESATTATFGDDNNELYVTFVRFGDLLGGEMNKEPALLARVLLENVVPGDNIEEPGDESTVDPVDDTTTTATTTTTTTTVTDPPVASSAAPVDDAPTTVTTGGETTAANEAPAEATTTSSKASSLSAKSSKATGKSLKATENLSSTSLISKSSKTSNVGLAAPTHSTPSMKEDDYSKSGKGGSHVMSMDVSATAKSAKANNDLIAAETTTFLTMTTNAPEATTAKSETTSHDEHSIPSKAAKTMFSKSAKAHSVGHGYDGITPTTISHNAKSTKMAKAEALFEGSPEKYSSKAEKGESMSMHQKSHESSAKSRDEVKMREDSSQFRLFKTKIVRKNDSLFK